MKLAMSQIAWCEEDERAALEILREYGFSGLEIAPTRVAGSSPYQSAEKAAKFAAVVHDEFGLWICSMQSIWYGQQGSMFGPEREHLMDYTKQAVLFAEAAGAGNIVFGNPKNRVIPQGKSADDALSFFKEAGDFAAIHSTTVALEANPPVYGTNFMNTTAQAFAVQEKVASAGCCVNLDIGTMLINNEQIEVLAGKMRRVNHVHISEPELAMIAPRALHRELAQLLREEGYGGYVSVEMKSQPLEEVRRAAAYLAEVFA